MLTGGGFNMKKVFSTFQTCALGFELKELLRKRVKYPNPMKVTKFENELYESGLCVNVACYKFWNMRSRSGRS